MNFISSSMRFNFACSQLIFLEWRSRYHWICCTQLQHWLITVSTNGAEDSRFTDLCLYTLKIKIESWLNMLMSWLTLRVTMVRAMRTMMTVATSTPMLSSMACLRCEWGMTNKDIMNKDTSFWLFWSHPQVLFDPYFFYNQSLFHPHPPENKC